MLTKDASDDGLMLIDKKLVRQATARRCVKTLYSLIIIQAVKQVVDKACPETSGLSYSATASSTALLQTPRLSILTRATSARGTADRLASHGCGDASSTRARQKQPICQGQQPRTISGLQSQYVRAVLQRHRLS